MEEELIKRSGYDLIDPYFVMNMARTTSSLKLDILYKACRSGNMFSFLFPYI